MKYEGDRGLFKQIFMLTNTELASRMKPNTAELTVSPQVHKLQLLHATYTGGDGGGAPTFLRIREDDHWLADEANYGSAYSAPMVYIFQSIHHTTYPRGDSEGTPIS